MIVLLPILLAMLLQIAPVQKWAVDTTTRILSEKSGTTFSVSRIEIGFFSRAYLEDVYVEDPNTQDTMIFIRRVDASINSINFFNGKIALGNVTIDSAQVHLCEDSTRLMNVKKVFDHFKRKVPRVDRPDFSMSATQLNLLNSYVTLQKYDKFTTQSAQNINFTDLDIRDINFQAQNIEMFNYDFRLAINHLSFDERSGFKLNHLSSPRCGVNETGMRYTNLRFETPRSTLICSHLNLLYESWWDYNDFVNKVTIDADILSSVVSLSTINYFSRAGGLDMPLTINMEGSVIGRVPDLRGEIAKLTTSDGSELKGSFNISGLPNVAQTDFLFTLDELTTDAQSIDHIVYTLTGKNVAPSVMNVLTQNQTLTASGEFFGLLRDFKAKCRVKSYCGVIDADLQLQPEGSLRNAVRMIGNLSSTDFNIREALGGGNNLNLITLSSNVDATVWGDSINLGTTAYIDKLDFYDYTYGPIELDGRFNNKVFTGNVKSAQDSNLIFETDGIFDFTNAELPSYNFFLDLEKANLVALGVNKRDSVSSVSANVRAFFTGTNIDNINGNVLLDSIIYVNHLEFTQTSDIDFFLKNSPQEKELMMSSRFADVTLRGHNSYYNIFGYLAQMARSYIPSFNDATEIVRGQGRGDIGLATNEEKYEDGYYTLDVDVKEANNVAGIFVPGLTIASGSTVDFFFNPARNSFSFSCESEFISTEKTFIENLSVNSRNIADSLSIYLTSSLIDLNGLEFPSFSLIGGIKNNRIDIGMRYSDKTNSNSAIFNIRTNIYRTPENLPQISLTVQPSNIRMNDRNWMMPESQVLIDSTGYTIDNFAIRSSSQYFSVDGKIGRLPSDSLDVVMQNVDVSPFSSLVSNLGYDLKGVISGSVSAVSVLSGAHMNAQLAIKDLYLGDNSLGSPIIGSQYSPSDNRVNLAVINDLGRRPITGYYDFAADRLHADFDFPSIDLRILEPMIKGALVNTSGHGSARLTLDGGLKSPALNGRIVIDKYRAMVDYTKVYYSLSGEVDVVDNCFTLQPTQFVDSENNGGDINAFLDSEYFRNVRFGVTGQFTDLLAINTTTKDNPYFFGKAYGTGTLNISGNDRNTNIVIVAQTANNSVIKMPFSDVSTIDRATFLSFVDPSAPAVDTVRTNHDIFRRNTRSRLVNELDIKLDVQVLPNTLATISYTNSLMDNIIEGRGTGRLQMHVNPTQEIFSLQGPVNIEKGTYRLIFAIADKTFTLLNGGNLLWTGSPSNPLVDFTGVYKVRASLEPLTETTLSGGSSKTTIECGIKLTGELFTPDISFDISAPNATPETQNILRNSLNTDEALSMQFMSLFVSSTFMPDMGTTSLGTMSGSILSTTGLEFVSNQISALISTNNIKIRPTFTPSSEENSEEVGIQASVSLLEDRIYIEAEGNYTAGELATNQQNPFTGEGGITVMLNKAQTLSMKGFTRIIDRFDESQGLQESGVGIYFRQSFQSWSDLKQRYLEYLDSRRKRRQDRKLARIAKRDSKADDREQEAE